MKMLKFEPRSLFPSAPSYFYIYFSLKCKIVSCVSPIHGVDLFSVSHLNQKGKPCKDIFKMIQYFDFQTSKNYM